PMRRRSSAAPISIGNRRPRSSSSLSTRSGRRRTRSTPRSAKRFRYAFLFGAGNERAGRIIYDTARAVHQLNPANGLQERLFGSTAHPGPTVLKRVGGHARDKFIAAHVGLRELRASIEQRVSERGWLRGLDGRRVP